jgi:hypothetical protein
MDVDFLSKIATVYKKKEQIAEKKNDQIMRKYLGYIVRYNVLVLILCKEDHPNVYKNESESYILPFNGWF